LSSDLGGGKTTFAKGLAKGLGSNDTVTSPTFTVGQVYQGRDGIEMHHFDFYRLSEGGMVAHELAEVMTDPKAVVVVEWGDVISDVLPEQRVTVQLSRVQSGEDYRVLHISYPKPLQYLVEGVSR
jgi:tRNA threonylcarbamoyladenosine biosynthesis protein TsaE